MYCIVRGRHSRIRSDCQSVCSYWCSRVSPSAYVIPRSQYCRNGILCCTDICLTPPNTKVLPTRLLFEVCLTDVDDYYDLKARMCANGTTIVHGIDFIESYSPTVDTDSFCLIMMIVASEGIIIVFIDTSNTFQTNMILDPWKQTYVSPPTMYLEWSKAYIPNHSLAKCNNSKEFTIQSLKKHSRN